MSVELQKLRSELLREALLKGWTRPADVPAPWQQQLPPQRLERWYKRLYKAPDGPLPVEGRLVNHFMLGADPEFVFHDGLQRCDARALGLKAGPAYGADNNGRLCELRPHPSRSALSVLTSMWLAMRWMVLYHPSTLAYSWRSGGYYEGDGLGGHVHFGRKREKLREREVACLDRLTHLQFVAGLFDKEEGRLRVRQAQGAPAGQPYGALGDVRRQPHGYEYRTLPSWIDGPWLAYFNLVLAKLTVAFPDLVAPLSEADALLGVEQARGQLRLILAYYSPLDDDARLAFAILNKRGWPQHASGMDFKSAWGIYPSGPLNRKTVQDNLPAVQPETVPSVAAEEHELACSMFEDRPPETGLLEPTWPHELPKDYVHCISLVDTKLAPGLGEFVMDLVMHKNSPLQFTNCGSKASAAFRFPVNLAKAIERSGLLQRLSEMHCVSVINTEPNNIQLNATKDFSLEQLLKARTLIVESGVFPLWSLSDVKANSYDLWVARQKDPEGPTGPKMLLNRAGT